MANRILDTRLRLKYDTAANWATKNPVLLAGEAGIEKDTLLAKVGDGTSTWQQLGYLNADYAKRVSGYFGVLASSEGEDILSIIYNGEETRGLGFDENVFVGSWYTNDVTGEPETDGLQISLKQSIKDILNGALRFDIAQSLTDAQKAQARANIGASGSDTGATNVEVTGTGNAVTEASYSSSTRKLTLTKGISFQEKLTAGTNITISGNTISAKNTDTGATSVEITGNGNAFTAASYDASARKITFTKGTTFQEKLTAGSNITISGNTISATDTTYTFTADNPTLAWSTKSKIGTIGGVEFNVTMPANPNTDTGATSVETSGNGNAVTTASYDAATRKLTLTKGTTFLTSHQSIKKLNTNNTTAQTANSSEAIAGSGTINLHKVAKTGNYNDLLNKPSFDDLTRIQKQGYAGDNSAIQYFKLATFPAYDSNSNYASFIVTGRMGGWESGNMSFVNMILYNRGAEGGGYINVDNSSFYNLCDVVIYREEDSTSTVYLKVKGYYTFDINVNTYQTTNAYTGTAITTPTGTLKWTASTNADRLAVSDGKAYINGFTLPKQIKINGTTHNPDFDGLVDLGTTPNTDTGATSVTVTGNGNAVTTASYSASTRKLTLTKGTTFVTTNTVQTISSVKTFSAGFNVKNWNITEDSSGNLVFT